ncbi:MAG: SpoIIE family protein phosphatase [Phycisphaerales bacterium]|jgi:sigma-B regulation protein RsbU (phosphoserine phosphatase)|nr:SpoIIE family protein phosphatase [Phycisphaerales bacterium]
MSIRQKLTILLVCLASAPLVVVAWLEIRATRRFGEQVAVRLEETLRRNASAQLERLVVDQSGLLSDAARRVDLAIRFQAEQVARALLRPSRSDVPLLTADDFDAGRVPETQITFDPRFERVGDDGKMHPRPISLARHSIAFCPGAGDDARRDAQRLTGLGAAFARVRSGVNDLVTWQYATLATGVHAVYPGHGGYPPGFDARERPWYRAAVEQRDVQWNVPIIDAATGQLVITVSAPIEGDPGEIVGATGMDIPVVDIVRHVDLPANLAEAARVLLVTHPNKLSEVNALPILASRDYTTGGATWDTPITLALLGSEDAGFASLVNDLTDGRAGVRTITDKGERTLWAYAPADSGRTCLIVIVPERVVVAAADIARQQVDEAFQRKVVTLASVAAGVLIVSAVVAVVAGGRVTGPVRRITRAAQRVAEGDLEARSDVQSRDELGVLSRAIDEMIPKLQERVKLVDSLQMAREVQQHLLPSSAPALSGIDVAASSRYCDETGGDYYDFLRVAQVDPGGIALAVGDVTGHGIAAALLMAGARAMMRVLSTTEHDPAGLLARLNEGMVADTEAGRFMTLYYLSIDASTRVPRWSSAGHDPAITFDPSTGQFGELGGTDVPLGIEPGWKFTDHQREPLRPGEVVVIGTDGIWEQRNAAGEMFTKNRLREVIRAHAHEPAASIVGAVHAAVEAWRGEVPQSDDVTLAVVRIVA